MGRKKSVFTGDTPIYLENPKNQQKDCGNQVSTRKLIIAPVNQQWISSIWKLCY